MEQKYIKCTIPVIGMSCSSCSLHIERKLNTIIGIKKAVVSLPSRSATIEFDEELVSLVQLKKVISDIGYELIIDQEQSVIKLEKQSYRSLVLKTCVSWLFSFLTMSLSMHWISLGCNTLENYLLFIVSLLNIMYCGREYYVRAIKQLKHGNANMDTLIALSTFIAFIFSAIITLSSSFSSDSHLLGSHSFYDASVMIISFSLTGTVLEERAKNSASSTIRTLIGLVPKTARVFSDGEIHEVPIATLVKGDVIEVIPGEKVPVDGFIKEILKSEVFIDESMITGEPIPIQKTIGDKVLCGTINKQGYFRFKAQEVGEKTMLSNIIRMVKESQNSKPPVQRVIDKIALIFVPSVIILSVITFFMWLFINENSNLSHAILSAVSVLVIACPCAMGLATPTALMVGMGKAAQNNILIKDATVLENIRKVTALVIDKTGTLTIPNKNVDFVQSENLTFEEREMLKPYAFETMKELQKNGIEVYMMSGDKEEAAQYWAKKAGIKHYKSKVLPQDKENLVVELQTKGHCVAMMGDGINDSQALARADVSIAMGSGTDIAMDIAQATLIGTDLRKILGLIVLSKKTVLTIHQNLFWAFIYNIICIPLAAGLPLILELQLQITPMWASALMAFSSVSVVLNSLRLKRIRI